MSDVENKQVDNYLDPIFPKQPFSSNSFKKKTAKTLLLIDVDDDDNDVDDDDDDDEFKNKQNWNLVYVSFT